MVGWGWVVWSIIKSEVHPDLCVPRADERSPVGIHDVPPVSSEQM